MLPDLLVSMSTAPYESTISYYTTVEEENKLPEK